MDTTANRRRLRPSHPGVHLADALDGLKAEAGVTRSAAAEGLGVGRRTLYDVLNGAAGLSPELAVRLEAYGLGSAESWLNLQQAHDVAAAREALADQLAAIVPAWPTDGRRGAAA